MVASLLAVETLWQRELLRFWRQKSRVLGVVASPLSFLGGASASVRERNGPKLFFPGTVTLTVMFSAIFSTMSIIEDRREGFLLSMLVSPASRTSLVLGKILGSATLAWIQGVVILAFAPLAGIRLSFAELLPLVGIIFLISFTLTSLGFPHRLEIRFNAGLPRGDEPAAAADVAAFGSGVFDCRGVGLDSRDYAGESTHLLHGAVAPVVNAWHIGRIAVNGYQPRRHCGVRNLAARGLRGAGKPEEFAQFRMKLFTLAVSLVLCGCIQTGPPLPVFGQVPRL